VTGGHHIDMKSVQQYTEMYRSAAQSAVPNEQVLCIGILSRPGAMKSALVGQASPLVGMIMRSKSKKKAGGFPLNVLMAVTPTRLISFEFKPRSNRVKIKRLVVEWPRPMVRVAAGEERKLSRQMFFGFPDGTSMELEGGRGFGRYDAFNDPFYAALGLLASPV
jgi:hypothetical protein